MQENTLMTQLSILNSNIERLNGSLNTVAPAPSQPSGLDWKEPSDTLNGDGWIVYEGEDHKYHTFYWGRPYEAVDFKSITTSKMIRWAYIK